MYGWPVSEKFLAQEIIWHYTPKYAKALNFNVLFPRKCFRLKTTIIPTLKLFTATEESPRPLLSLTRRLVHRTTMDHRRSNERSTVLRTTDEENYDLFMDIYLFIYLFGYLLTK